MSDKTLSAKEARVEIARLRQGVPLKPGIRKILANTLEVYADQMDDFYDDGRGIRARRGTDDMTETQETLHRHRDASLPYQEWNHPFKPDDIVTVSGRSGERTDRAKDLWWGYEREFGDVADAVILSARLATEEEKAELVNARSVESVKAEAHKQGAAEERERLMKLALGSEEDDYASYDGYVAEWLRSNSGERHDQ